MKWYVLSGKDFRNWIFFVPILVLLHLADIIFITIHIYSSVYSFANFVRCRHTALQQAKRRNTLFSIDPFCLHQCHELSTIFLLNEKFGIAWHRLHFRFSEFYYSYELFTKIMTLTVLKKITSIKKRQEV